MSEPRDDYVAPRWLTQLLRLEPGPLPWPAALRAAVGMGAPLVAGLLAGQVQLGLQASLGAFPGVVNDQRGSHRGRFRRIGVAVVAATAGYVAGAWITKLFGTGPAAWVALGGVALVSALVSAGGNLASVGGLVWLIFATIGIGRPPEGEQVWQAPAAILAGGLWMLFLVAVSGLLGRTHAPERRAVADVYRVLAELLASIGAAPVEPVRRELTAALNSGYDTVTAARTGAWGRDPETFRLVTLLSDVTAIIEAAVAISRERAHPLPAAVPRTVRAMSAAVLGTAEAPVPPDLPRDTPGMAALYTGLEKAAKTLAGGEAAAHPDERRVLGARAAPVPLRRTLRDILVPGRRTALFATQLTSCIVVAQALRDVLPLERTYWIPLAVAIVLRPDFGPVVTRALLSVAGTVVGVAIGTALILAVQPGLLAAAVTAVAAALLPIALSRNFGLFFGLISLVLLLLLEQVGQADLETAQARLVDTTIGSLVVLAVGYLPWPTARRVGIGPYFGDAAEHVVAYLRCALTDPGSDERRALRRSAYRDLSDLRTVFQRALAEPPPGRTRAAAWWPAIIALERVVDAATAAAVSIVQGSPPPSAEGVERLARALGDAAGASRGGQALRSHPAPEEHLLQGLAAEVHAVRTALTGPPAGLVRRSAR